MENMNVFVYVACETFTSNILFSMFNILETDSVSILPMRQTVIMVNKNVLCMLHYEYKQLFFSLKN